MIFNPRSLKGTHLLRSSTMNPNQLSNQEQNRAMRQARAALRKGDANLAKQIFFTLV